MKRECNDAGIRGRYLGFLFMIFDKTVSWYILITFSSVVTGGKQNILLGRKVDNSEENVRASDANSASLKRPGRNQVIDRKEDSKEDIVETLLRRKDS